MFEIRTFLFQFYHRISRMSSKVPVESCNIFRKSILDFFFVILSAFHSVIILIFSNIFHLKYLYIFCNIFLVKIWETFFGDLLPIFLQYICFWNSVKKKLNVLTIGSSEIFLFFAWYWCILSQKLLKEFP